jgi:adenylate kinase family enzyme
MRIAIIGNSGSGKSTLARMLGKHEVPTLDLDTIVWEPNRIAVARDHAVVLADLHAFCSLHTTWILEGCYAFCAEAALAYDPELIWLDPGLDACLQNCKSRPWEPHKYASKAEQDAKLPFLLDWVAGYYTRDDDMSQHTHRALFDSYDGPKRHLTALPSV